MRRVFLWALQAALGSADLVLSGAPIPAIVAVKIWETAAKRG